MCIFISLRMCQFLGSLIALWAVSCIPCLALEPHEVLVVANRNASRSVGLGRYYMEKRGIPASHLVEVWVTDREWCSREEYERKVAGPVRRFLAKEDPKRRIRCLVTCYGVPLKIVPPETTLHEKAHLEALEKRRASLKAALEEQSGRDGDTVWGLKREHKDTEKEIADLRKGDQGAALDSELALVRGEAYSLSGWTANPFFVGYQNRYVEDMPGKGEVVMVSRLDGSTPEIVRRVIDDSVETEKKGLDGTAYFDARWPRPKNEKHEKGIVGYPFYDRSIHLAAERVEKSGRMRVVLDDSENLFQKGECPDAAVYCGWYSLARYVDAFKWRPGSVGYHIASAECQTLKQRNSQVWCKRMLEEGIAATLGPVGEPYVQAFPVPDLFFSLLLDGYWTLAECYALSQPFWSWQMVLIGDPLYRPFRRKTGL